MTNKSVIFQVMEISKLYYFIHIHSVALFLYLLIPCDYIVIILFIDLLIFIPLNIQKAQ